MRRGRKVQVIMKKMRDRNLKSIKFSKLGEELSELTTSFKISIM